MKAHYHFHIHNFVQISPSQVNELLAEQKEHKSPLFHETFESFQKGVASGLGNSLAAELLLKLGHILKMLRF